MTSPASFRALQRDWPGYHKPMPRHDLRRRLGLDAVRRAGTPPISTSRGLLETLGLI